MIQRIICIDHDTVKIANGFGKWYGQINYYTFMNIMLYAKNEKQLESFVHTVRILSNGVATEFGIQMCAILVRKI